MRESHHALGLLIILPVTFSSSVFQPRFRGSDINVNERKVHVQCVVVISLRNVFSVAPVTSRSSTSARKCSRGSS